MAQCKLYARGGGGGGSQEREVAGGSYGADVVFTDTGWTSEDSQSQYFCVIAKSGIDFNLI